ncbi:MAG: hypothetical protein FE78DRAFT_414899 [Acidomyces sp. 'richmondensis']|nr:MAG: hypothetical protein FE78DRAFT_414899 [Acidomyces sp. 'richmondensis']
MMHGSTAPVSSGSNSSHAATASALPKHHARAGSLSSSSIVTVKRAGSISSASSGPRTSTAPMRSQSPGELSLIALRLGRDHIAEDHKRRKSIAVESSGPGEGEGLNNLNRWSHSTNSSTASIGITRRSRSSSGVAPQSQSNHQFSQIGTETGLEHSPRSSPHRQGQNSRPDSRNNLYSPKGGVDGVRARPSRPDLFANSLTALPPLHITPSLTDPNDTESPSTIATVATPSTHSSYSHSYTNDYFGEDGMSPRSAAKNKKPVLIRNYTAPMSQFSHQSLQYGEDLQQEQWHRREQTSEPRDHVSRPSGIGESHTGHKRSKTREVREKDKKAMLSKALQQANTAVLLDNAQNFEGALEAYTDACRLLQQVMDRSSGADDKRKLEQIRITYTNRIEELRQLEMSRPSTSDDKDLPARPMSDDSMNMSPINVTSSPTFEAVQDSAVIGTATATSIADVPKLSCPKKDRNSFFLQTLEADQDSSQMHSQMEEHYRETAQIQTDEKSIRGGALRESDVIPQTLQIPSSEDSKYMPAPLSPRKPLSPQLEPEADEAWNKETEQPLSKLTVSQQATTNNDNSMTWLDTIDESGSDCASVHSVSQGELRRKHIRHASGETDPDFDAAFDAAVEAAYDQGFEPDLEARKIRNTSVKHGEKTSVLMPNSEVREVLSSTNDFYPGKSLAQEPEDDEEERLLDEITQDYAQGFNFDLSSKSALPRQSDSSGYSRSTWQSSQVSNGGTTAATSLSTVAEDTLPVRLLDDGPSGTPSSVSILRQDQLPPSAPPMTALPQPPNTSTLSSGVRSRRMSGQANPKPLKIETAGKPEQRKRASTFHHSVSPLLGDEEQKTAFDSDFKLGATLEPTKSKDSNHENILKSPPSLDMREAVAETSRRPQAFGAADSRRSLDKSPGELRSTRPSIFRKNKSSVSLREHTVLLSSPEDLAPSIVTPMSSTFTVTHSKRQQDPLTSQRAKFTSLDVGAGNLLQSGGAYLFDTSLTSNQNPSSPRSPINSAQPACLEPCPDSFLLRPFWLMRAISSTLTHPKGGFLTTRLFVPREVWHTRGVKLKSLEDKVANCDLLTAALGRLAGVDTYDADAIMEELQNFEEVMERVQSALSKKLGGDVGLHGVTGLFKDASGINASGPTFHPGSDAVSGAEKITKGKEGKGYLTSWRKLRSKSSGAPLSTSHLGKTTEKEALLMSSVPMTSFVPVERRGHKKDVRNLAFEGPQREYMGSLARLFEGAQILDQIARQVEDPGLKHSSPTHVGLELSIRHAAEFFGFYICRFVLADLGTLLDKFVKRGTEWVLA